MKEEEFIRTPTALTVWTLGTGFLGGLASMALAKRAEKAGWSRFKTGYIVTGVIAASAINIIIASRMRGE